MTEEMGVPDLTLISAVYPPARKIFPSCTAAAVAMRATLMEATGIHVLVSGL